MLSIKARRIGLFLILFFSAIFFLHQNQNSCFRVEFAEVVGDSMEPLIVDEARIQLLKNFYDCHSVERNDLVLIDFAARDLPMIKKIIALPGDQIIIREGQIFVNENLVENSVGESYFLEDSQKQKILSAIENEFLTADNFLVLGDNLKNSLDSRTFGPVFRDQIVGKIDPNF